MKSFQIKMLYGVLCSGLLSSSFVNAMLQHQGLEGIHEDAMHNGISSFLDDASLAHLNQANCALKSVTQAALTERHAHNIAQNLAKYAYETFVAAMTSMPVEAIDEIIPLIPELRKALYDSTIWFTGYSLRSSTCAKRVTGYEEYYVTITTMYDSFYQNHRNEPKVLEAISLIFRLVPHYFQQEIRTRCATKLFSFDPKSMNAEVASLSCVLQECCCMLLAINTDDELRGQFLEKFKKVHDWLRELRELADSTKFINSHVVMAANELFKLMHCLDPNCDFKNAFNELYLVMEQYLQPVLEKNISYDTCINRLANLRKVLSDLLGLELPKLSTP
jgi:hypothetical protein